MRKRAQRSAVAQQALQDLQELRALEDPSTSEREAARSILTTFGGESTSPRARYGTNVRKAAKALGISEKEARGYAEFSHRPEPLTDNMVYGALTGHKGADVSGQATPQDTGDFHGMMLAAGGRTRRGQTDTAAVAKAVGVSQRSVQRWKQWAETGKGNRPSAKHFEALRRAAQKANSTKRGRQVHTDRLRQQFSRGGTLALTGSQGPNLSDNDYFRTQTVTLDLSPEEAQEMIDAWENGGTQGFREWNTDFMSRRHMSGWTLSSLDDLSITPDTRGR